MLWGLTLPNAIRLATGALWVLFGIWLLAQRASSPRARPLASLLIALGAGAAVSNLPATTATGIGARALTMVPLYVVAAIALAQLFRHEAREGRRSALASALFGVLAGSAGCAVQFLSAAEPFPVVDGIAWAMAAVGTYAAFLYLVLTGMGAYALLAGLRARHADRHTARELAAVAAVTGMVPSAFFTSGAIVYGLEAGRFISLLPFLAALVAWSRARAGPGSAAAAGLAIMLFLAPLATTLVRITGRDVGLTGIVRVVALAVLAYGVFRWGALGLPQRPTRDRRAALLTSFLVVLLIVAQIAQNFLSAQYGLLMGGVVAGALLVAARPIERALEGRHLARTPAAGRGAAEAAYRKALRVAMRDRVLTREEETHLHELAEELGIGAGRAHAIFTEVEREAEMRSAETSFDAKSP